MVPQGAANAFRPLVLLVEDDASLQRALTFSLELEGFRVELCESGESLLRRPAPLRPACLVVDQRLPGITGIEALALMRQRRVVLPAILITTQPSHELRATAAALGVRILEKPLLGGQLSAAIQEALA